MTTQSTNTARRALGPRAILPHPRAVCRQVVSTSTTHGFRDLSTPASNSRSLSTLLDSSRDFVRDLSLAGSGRSARAKARGSLACFAERSRSGATCDDPRRASPSPTLLSHAVNVRSWARNHPTTTHPTILSAARAGRKTKRRAGHVHVTARKGTLIRTKSERFAARWIRFNARLVRFYARLVRFYARIVSVAPSEPAAAIPGVTPDPPAGS
jgi:hypothetical protein